MKHLQPIRRSTGHLADLGISPVLIIKEADEDNPFLGQTTQGLIDSRNCFLVICFS